MKTKKMVLHDKEASVSSLYACAECFCLLEVEDNYCWNCGAEFGDDDNTFANDADDLRGNWKKV